MTIQRFSLSTATLRRAVLVLAGAMAVATTGCASDTTVSGPQLSGLDAATAADGTVTAPDGEALKEVSILPGDDAIAVGPDIIWPDGTVITPDGTVISPDGSIIFPDDATTSPDGGLIQPDVPPGDKCPAACGDYVEGAKCQCDEQCAQYGDCCGSYEAQCGGTVGPGPGPAEGIVACITKECPNDISACQKNQTCAEFLSCAQACSDQQCLFGCAQSGDFQALQQYVLPLYQCGNDAGCLDGGGTGPGPDPTPTGPVCGDNKCEQPENTLNCDKDCDNPPGAAQQCIYDKCPTQYKACFDNQSCVAALACYNETNSFQQCAGNQQTGQLLGGFLQCGQQQGCFGGTQPQPTGPVCGDGKCDSPENKLNCSKDCTTEPSATQQCIFDKCNKQYTDCFGDAACLKAVACYNQQQSVQQCSAGSQSTATKLQSMLTCGQQQGCFGGTTPTPTASCAGKCGQFQQGASCQCTTLCTQFGNCCSDYAALCTTQPADKCGDGICSSATENATNCAADCGGPVIQCKAKADCKADQICCGKADGSQVCLAPADCK